MKLYYWRQSGVLNQTVRILVYIQWSRFHWPRSEVYIQWSRFHTNIILRP